MSVNFSKIQDTQTPPPLFERGAPMWHAPYIARQMLQYHLGESHDIASRRPEIINNIINWISEKLNLSDGMHLLDLGCGPGLYTSRFAERGLHVTGVDYSQNSINYAQEQDNNSTYICQDYTSLKLADNQFDVVMMIYGDLCVLSDAERDGLLSKINRWLKPDGAFVFDVTTPQVHAYLKDHKSWSVAPDGGFWKPTPYMVLEQGFMYDDDVTLEQFILIQDDGAQTVYRNWYRDYTPETLSHMLKNNGYNQVETYADLTGQPYTDGSDWIGVIAKP